MGQQGPGDYQRTHMTESVKVKLSRPLPSLPSQEYASGAYATIFDEEGIECFEHDEKVETDAQIANNPLYRKHIPEQKYSKAEPQLLTRKPVLRRKSTSQNNSWSGDKFTMKPNLTRLEDTSIVSLGDLAKLAESLQIAIKHGDIPQAMEAAQRLAIHKTNLAVEVQEPGSTNQEKPDSEIRVVVHVEDKESTGGRVNLKVKTSMTIRELKRKMLYDYGFPPDVQKWIIGRRIVKDFETLSKCGIKHDGDPVYMYLVSAQSVGLEPGTFVEDEHGYITAVKVPEIENEYISMSGGYIAMGPPGSHPRRPSTSSGGRPSCPAPPPPETAPEQVQPSPASQNNLPQETQESGIYETLNPLEVGMVTAHPPAPVQAQATAQTQSPPPVRPLPEIQEPEPESEPEHQLGWVCQQCTYLNVPTRPGCEMCAHPRPADYQVPEGYHITDEERRRLEREDELERLAREAEEQSRIESFNELIEVDNQDLVPNTYAFSCPVCFETIPPGEGIVLRECLHTFCRECLEGQIRYNEDAAVQCPFQDDDYTCTSTLTEREIKALVPRELFERYLQRSLVTAESRAENSYHCKTPDCPGWTIYDDNDNFFNCPVCGNWNCLTCKAIHPGMNCQEYQVDLKIRATNDSAARQSQEMLEEMLRKGDAMHCPQCDVIVQKKDGCDWIMCTMCKLEICWVTKGRRWGPLGAGDVSGGCMCRVNNQKCHPNCNNCH